MKPIETVYKGYRFRSRLEARWAVFYDTLKIPYRYELQGFDLSDEFGGAFDAELNSQTRYLPDFWLPDQDCWVEIKGAEPTKIERRKAELLAVTTQRSVYIFYGDCWMPDGSFPPDFAEPDGPAEAWIVPSSLDPDEIVDAEDNIRRRDVVSIYDATWDNHYCWCECWKCGKFGIQFEGRSARICRHDDQDKHYNSDSPLLKLAYTAARQARFEHGESGEGHA